MHDRPLGASARRPDVHSVTSLTFALKELVEGRFARVAVEGEVVGARRGGSGHVYFTLKDEKAQLPCVVWRSTVVRLPLELRDGMQVVVGGPVQIYPPHGRYQLIVQRIREAGLGSLLARLEELKRGLAAEGLFDPARKHPLPTLPRRVGVVTAPGGAALHDILTTLAARWPRPVLLYPCPVQGPDAARAIARGVELLGTRPGVDVIIVGRGGGSLEDLWAFNEEAVVRAIARSQVPIVSAVGHEIDTVLSDLAADRRAATPTAAAELVVPSRRELGGRVAAATSRLAVSLRRQLEGARLRIRAARFALGDPRRPIAERQQRLDDAVGRLHAGMRRHVARARERRAAVGGRLRNLHPQVRLRAARLRLDAARARLMRTAGETLERRQRRLSELARTLRAVGPTASLARGYAVVRTPDGRVVHSALQAEPTDRLEVILHRGALDVDVARVHPTNAFQPEET